MRLCRPRSQRLGRAASLTPRNRVLTTREELPGFTVTRVDWISVIRSFADDTTADVYYGHNSQSARRLPRTLWPVLRRKLDAVHHARRPQDLRVPAGNRLETLKGARRGTLSLRVNEQYRITFRWENGDAYEVRCEDYH